MALRLTQMRFEPQPTMPATYVSATFVNVLPTASAEYQVRFYASEAEYQSKTFVEMKADALARFQLDYPNLGA